MKQIVSVLMMLVTRLAVAQPGPIPKNIRSAFEGTWQIKEKHYTNTFRLNFEPGKDNAKMICTMMIL